MSSAKTKPVQTLLKELTEYTKSMSIEEFNKIYKEKGLDKKVYNTKDYEDENFRIILPI